MYEYNTYRLQDLRTGLQTILDQLETMGYPYPLCADFKVTITSPERPSGVLRFVPGHEGISPDNRPPKGGYRRAVY